MKKTKKIDSAGLWLVKFDGNPEAEVIRIVEGKMGQDTEYQFLTCRETGDPNAGVIPFCVTKGHIEKVYRKIKDPLG